MAEHSGKARIPAGDWEILYRRYYRGTRQYFALRVRDPTAAGDLAQQVFVELAQTNVTQEPRAYILAIARNLLAEHQHRKALEQTSLARYLQYDDAATSGPDGDSIATIEQILRTVTCRLSSADAELVTLRFIKELPTKEIAQRMACSEDAIRERIERIRAVLRRLCRE